MQTHEPWVHDLRERAKLLFQPVDRRAIHLAERLERDELAALLVVRLEHDAHRAFAETSLHHEAIRKPRADEPRLADPLEPQLARFYFGPDDLPRRSYAWHLARPTPRAPTTSRYRAFRRENGATVK